MALETGSRSSICNPILATIKDYNHLTAESGGDADKLLGNYLLGDENDLRDEEGPTIEEIMEMDIDRISDDDIDGGRFSRTEAERTFEDCLVLETATRLSADMHQEILAAKKATGSSERAGDRNEDPGAEFKKNMSFMRKTLPPAAACTGTAKSYTNVFKSNGGDPEGGGPLISVRESQVRGTFVRTCR